MAFECAYCKLVVKTKFNLARHIQKIHQPAKDTSKNDFELETISLTFASQQEFNDWKEKEQVSTSARYVQQRGVKYNKDKTISTRKYYCHRSGVFNSKSTGKRALKIIGSCKIDQYCPSFIRASTKDNLVKVKYCKTHLGHLNEVKFLPIPNDVQETIAGKIKNGIPPSVIVDQLREEIDNKVEKKNIITRKDIYNISKKCGLLHKYKLHSIDTLSVDLQVKHIAQNSSSPIVFYKTHGTDYLPLNKGDFMMVILTETQIALLNKFSNGKLCIDSTHGTDQYSFHLTTIIVIDELGDVFPAAFCISTKVDEVNMSVFFSKIKEIIGCLNPDVFMSDDVPAFRNAWIKTMAVPKFYLLCKWHVDNNWRKNLKKIEGSQTTQSYVYKALRVLLEEPDKLQFENILQSFLCKLGAESGLQNFKKYFESNYVNRKRMWAACYQNQVMPNTYVYLETFHNTLKHIYSKFQFKKKQRLDMLLWHLLKIVRDKNIERLVKLCSGEKVNDYINNINTRHRSAVHIKSSQIDQTSEVTWIVKSESFDHGYIVQKQQSCSCKIMCVACKVCAHLFSCTCDDYSIKNNMCKHIHAVIINVIKEENINVFEEVWSPLSDEICTNTSTEPNDASALSTEGIANKIQQFYDMFVSQTDSLNEQQLKKINSLMNAGLKVLYEQE